MIHIAICEGDYKIAHKLEDILLEAGRRAQIEMDLDVYYAGISLQQKIAEGYRYDIAFLEIEGGEACMEVAEAIRRVDTKVLLVFGASSNQALIKLFSVNTFSVLMKPYNPREVDAILRTAYRKVCSRKFYFVYRYKKQEYKLLCEDIIYFESKRRRLEIHLKDGRTEIFNGKLDDIENKLKGGWIPFLRVHQSYLVNFHEVRCRECARIHMKNGETLPISSNRQKTFDQLYLGLLKEESGVYA